VIAMGKGREQATVRILSMPTKKKRKRDTGIKGNPKMLEAARKKGEK